MNDPNKVISVNLSSLLSLKAELLRKQAEVNRVKSTKVFLEEYEAHKASKVEHNVNKESDPTATKNKLKKTERYSKVDKNDDSDVYENEDTALLEKSHRTLVAKSKFYERMSKSGGTLNSDDNCLVMFNKKRQECRDDSHIISNDNKRDESDNESDIDDNDDDESIDSDDEWVEYTDCLGRTRKCLRKDLAENKKRDAELAASMPERLDQTKANWMIDTFGSRRKHSNEDDDGIIGPILPQSVYGDGISVMSKHEEQKANWERKEQENFEKTDVHYQDVFFDEARQHGVGYYAFSTDEEERQRQQKELEKARQETLEEQEKREVFRKQRENIIAERVWAAKNRQRARLGLPPLDKSEMEKERQEKLAPQESKKQRKERKKAEKLAKKREQEEKEREEERQHHIRPWDLQKNDVKLSVLPSMQNDAHNNSEEWAYKPEREPMTQEQWNEYKRSERIDEFAPLAEKQIKRTNFTMMPSPVSTFYTDSHKCSLQANLPSDTFAIYQSTKGQENSAKIFKKRNYGFENKEEVKDDRKGAAIPPPENLDCNNSFQTKKTKSSCDLEKSIEAGLRFLRNNYDKQSNKTKTMWTANADY